MKKRLHAVLFLVFLAIVIPSCELFDDCKNCSLVTYIDGEYEEETTSVLYCGDELEEKEDASPVIIDNRKTQWECY